MENSSLLQVESLCVAIGGRGIVRDVSFSIEQGKTLCLVGESGSGKTTASLALMGLLSKKRGFKASGKVRFDGKELLGLSDSAWQSIRGRDISMIFQDPTASLNPILTIGDQVREIFEVHTDLSEEEAEAKTIGALASVGLADLHNPFETYPHQLSGGMKQRVMIAMALCLSPKLLIADEPTSALDLTVQKDILMLLKKFQGTTLLITHDFGVVAEMADVVAVMYKGEIVELQAVRDIFNRPAHPYTKALLAARPTKENRKQFIPIMTP